MITSSENLLTKIPVEKPKKPAGFYESIVLDVLAISSALVFSLSYYFYLNGLTSILASILALLAFALFSTLELFIIKELWRRAIIIILEASAFLVLFINFPIKTSLIAVGVLLIFFAWGEFAGRMELRNTLRIKFLKIAHRNLSKVITGIALAAVILYLPQLDAGSISISEKNFQVFFDWAAGITDRIYPEIKLNGTVGDAARDIATMKLKDIPDFNELPFADQQNSINRAAAEVIRGLSQALKINISSQQPVSEILYNLLISTLENWRGRFGILFTIGWGIILFLIVRSIGIILAWLGALLAFLIFNLLLTLNVIHMIGENTMQEVVEF